MIHVLLASSRDDLAASLTDAIGPSFARVPGTPVAESPADLYDRLPGVGRPHIVLLDSDGEDEAALSLAERLQRDGVATILVSSRASELALPALRAGVRDLITPDIPAAELRLTLDRAAQLIAPQAPQHPDQVAPSAPEQEGRVIAVASPKGGVGKTTVATNLAVGLAALAPQATVLVDLDVHFGDVATALNLTPEHTLPEFARSSASRDALALKTFLTRHETGLYVVPGSDDPAAADAVTPEDVSRLLTLLKTQFAYVVVDTAPGLSEHTLAVLDETDTLVLVTSLDVPGVRGLRKELDTLSQLHMKVGAQHVVLNFTEASRGLSVADVEATIRTRVDVVLPQSSVVPLSVNQGIPLLQSGGRDPVTQRLRKLVQLVAPDAAPTPRRALFGRRAR